MDFLDSISKTDSDLGKRKAYRVRSWYLYEQYKSLEQNQLDAARKLKDRSYQEKILHQELNDRRARRQLYDKLGLHCGESLTKSIKSEGAEPTPSVTSHDFYETFSDIENEQILKDGQQFEDDALSVISGTSKTYSVAATVEMADESYDDSTNSVVENLIADNVADDVKEELEIAKKNIAENIKLQIETVKNNLKSLEKFSKIYDNKSDTSLNQDDENKNEANSRVIDSNLFTLWSKLVSFAYQIIQLNHGNCYYDYSSQLLTGVLACDVVRKSIHKVCNILQPYVCPIRFSTDSDTSIVSYKKNKRKKFTHSTGIPFEYKPNLRTHQIINNSKYRSDNYWQFRNKYSLEKQNYIAKNRRSSEPRRSVARFSTKSTQKDANKTASSCTWIEEIPCQGNVNCHCYPKKYGSPKMHTVFDKFKHL